MSDRDDAIRRLAKPRFVIPNSPADTIYGTHGNKIKSRASRVNVKTQEYQGINRSKLDSNRTGRLSRRDNLLTSQKPMSHKPVDMNYIKRLALTNRAKPGSNGHLKLLESQGIDVSNYDDKMAIIHEEQTTRTRDKDPVKRTVNMDHIKRLALPINPKLGTSAHYDSLIKRFNEGEDVKFLLEYYEYDSHIRPRVSLGIRRQNLFNGPPSNTPSIFNKTFNKTDLFESGKRIGTLGFSRGTNQLPNNRAKPKKELNLPNDSFPNFDEITSKGDLIFNLNFYSKYCNDYNERCVICTDGYQNDKCINLHCKHVFHLECIKKWVDRMNSCPICRRRLYNFKGGNKKKRTYKKIKSYTNHLI